jgi:Sulfotransferase family
MTVSACSDNQSPLKRTFKLDDIMPVANARFDAHRRETSSVAIDEKARELRYYDVMGMERVVAVCCTGSSGSLLLASYLDSHDQVLLIPGLLGTRIYKFLELHESLPLRDKLIVYPLFGHNFFDEQFPISPAGYYGAVQALLAMYADRSPEFLLSRRTFFLFLHLAYNMALDRRLATSRPLIVYAQHAWNNSFAARLVEDFPHAKFIHTVRNPIVLYDRAFGDRLSAAENRLRRTPATPHGTRLSDMTPPSARSSRIPSSLQKIASLMSRRHFGVLCPINRDRPHVGMESRTLAVRFEDLHLDTAQTMYKVADWLELSHQPTLLASTFNGIPWVVERNGRAWSGSRESQAKPELQNVSRSDRMLLLAVFYEDFVAWNYRRPRILRTPAIRWIVGASLLLIPMKMELAVAYTIFRRTVIPEVRAGSLSIVIRFLLSVLFYRAATASILALEFLGRRVRGKTLLELAPGWQGSAKEL